MKLRAPRANLVITFGLLAILLLLAAGAGVYVMQQHVAAQSRLADLEPRFARMLGLQASGKTLDDIQTTAQHTLARYIYPASPDKSQAGNDAQQRLRDTFSKAGLQIMSSQVLPPKPGKFFDQIPLNMRLEGEISQLQSALLILAAQTPMVIVDNFMVQTLGLVRADTAQRLSIQFDVSVLRAQP